MTVTAENVGVTHQINSTGGSLDMPWQEIAVRLFSVLGEEAVHSDVRKVLESFFGGPIAVACSGGADSVCVLLLMWTAYPELRQRLVVIHFNHHLRGADSDGDAAFVQHLAASLGLRCETGDWTPPDDPSEENARRARMAFLHQAVGDSGIICFGHHADDVAETLLLRIGRGSGLDGLAGPRPVQRFSAHSDVVHVRPLLNLRSKHIRESLSSAGGVWREDITNHEGRYVRNRLRNEVIPLLSDILERDWAAAAGRSRARIEEADSLLNELAAPLVSGGGQPLLLRPIQSVHLAVARRAFELWLAASGLRVHLTADSIEDLLRAIGSGSAYSRDIASGRIVISAIDVTYEPSPDGCDSDTQWSPRILPGSGKVFFPWGRCLSVERVTDRQRFEEVRAGRTEHGLDEAWFDFSIDNVLTIRTWQPGDAYTPLGAPGRAKLQDQFVNRKIPPWERRRLPVVTLGNEDVLWCPGLLPAHQWRLTDSSESAVRLTYLSI